MFLVIRSEISFEISLWDKLMPLNEKISLSKILGRDSKVILALTWEGVSALILLSLLFLRASSLLVKLNIFFLLSLGLYNSFYSIWADSTIFFLFFSSFVFSTDCFNFYLLSCIFFLRAEIWLIRVYRFCGHALLMKIWKFPSYWIFSLIQSNPLLIRF